MATIDKAPRFVKLSNMFTMTLLRAGVPLNGFGNYPMYLLTVRGRKSGQPRTVPVALLEHEGKRYIASPYGKVNWVRNLQAAGEAVLTRGRRSETVTATVLPNGEAARVLQLDVKAGNPFASSYGVTKDSSLQEFEQAVETHPLFILQKAH